MDMRGLDTKVRKRRQEVFTEIAKVAYNSENLLNDIEEMPYKIVHTDKSEYWENV